MLPLQVSSDIKEMILRREYSKDEVIKNIYKKYGRIESPQSLGFWYDCCYASVCEGMGIDRKNGEELRLKKRKVRMVMK